MKESLAARVFHTLEEEILNGSRQPGDPLTELQLCQELGVSRTPVREALNRLEQEGLAATLPNRSVVVAGITVSDMLDIYEIRLRVEGLAARRCATRLSSEALRELTDLVDLQEFYTQKEQPQQLRTLDSQFHHLLYRHCGSPALTATLTNLHRKVRHFRQTSMAESDRANQTLAEHRAIVNALAAHDPDAADRAATAHIDQARRRLATLYQQTQEEQP